MKIYLVIVALIVVSLLSVVNVQAVPIGYDPWLDVTAWIDGSDWFEITGNTWRWQHDTWNVPEQEGMLVDPGPPEVVNPGPFPTVVNGQSFNSTWLNGKDQYDYSEYNTVTGLLPIEIKFGSNVQIYLEILGGRESTTLEQAPDAGHSYTTRVFLDDIEPSGAAWYHFKIYGMNPDQCSVPEPSTIVLLGAGITGLGLLRRRFKS
jgi:hypothetical protein